MRMALSSRAERALPEDLAPADRKAPSGSGLALVFFFEGASFTAAARLGKASSLSASGAAGRLPCCSCSSTSSAQAPPGLGAAPQAAMVAVGSFFFSENRRGKRLGLLLTSLCMEGGRGRVVDAGRQLLFAARRRRRRRRSRQKCAHARAHMPSRRFRGGVGVRTQRGRTTSATSFGVSGTSQSRTTTSMDLDHVLQRLPHTHTCAALLN